jgi:outer membrane protein, heavy metal efflux system
MAKLTLGMPDFGVLNFCCSVVSAVYLKPPEKAAPNSSGAWKKILVACVFSAELLSADGAQMNQSLTMPTGKPEPLAKLVAEATNKNPELLAARRAWQAAAQVPDQASTLPDPEVTVQQFSVGSPRPFAGYTSSNFAYIGFGVSQELPYPGKLRLRGEMARHDAGQRKEQLEAARRSIVEQVKTAYFHLAYLQQTLSILERDDKLLEEIEKVAEARYRTGKGNQQDVLKAQLQRTKLLREFAMHHQEIGSTQALLKQLLNRPSDAPEITAEELTLTTLTRAAAELLSLVRRQNPQIAAEQELVKKQSAQVELAHKDFFPDFKVQYMYQHTGPDFPDYYMLTVGARIPIHRLRKQQPELTQAIEDLNGSRHQYEADVQQAYFEVKDRLLAAETAARLIKIYHDGLIPQATAAFQSGLNAYESNQQDFESLLSSFADVLNLDVEYWKTLADHETALAQLERLTGLELVQ